jgi:hypothetical protein
MVMMPPPVVAQANTACAQSSVASTTAQPYPVDCISISTSCLLPYPVGRAGKRKVVAKAQVEPVGVNLREIRSRPYMHMYKCNISCNQAMRIMR